MNNPKTILLVEDEVLISMNEKMILEESGYKVLTAGDGEKAIAAVASNPGIDLILMDIDLGSGRMDGTEAAQIILGKKDIPIVFLSSHTEPEIVEKTEKITSYGYVVKNSGITVLDASIKMAFRLFDEKQNVRKHQAELTASNEELESTNEELAAANEQLQQSQQEIFQREKQIKRERDRAQRYLDIAGVILIALNARGDVTLVNQKGCEVLDWPLDKIIGKNWFDIFLPVHIRDEVKSVFKQLITGDIDPVEYFENSILTSKGEEKIIAWHNSLLMDSRGVITGILSSGEDITERKKIENELIANEAFLHQVIDQSPIATWISDAEGTLQLANPVLKRFLNLTDEQLVGKYNVLKDPHVEKQGFASLIRSVFEDGETVNFTAEWDGNDIPDMDLQGSSSVFLEGTMFPVHDIAGKLTNVVLNWIDITSRKRAEEALLTEKQFTDTALDAQVDTFFLFEPASGKAVRWNRAFREISGYSDDEIAGLPAPAAYYSPEDLERAGVFTGEVIKTGTGTIEMELVCKDGSRVPTEYRVSVIYDENNEPKHIISIGRDISARRRIEQKLKESEKLFRSAFDYSAAGMALVTLEGAFLSVNNAVSHILGYSEDELLKKQYMDITCPGDRDLSAAKYSGLLNGEYDFYHLEKRYIHKNGHPVWGKLTCALVRDDAGKPLYTVALLEDITERKQAEEQLRVSEEKYRTLFNTVPYGIDVTDPEGKIVFSNPAHHRIMGYEPGELIGKKFTEFIMDEEGRKEAMLFYRKLIDEEPEPVPYYNRNRTKDGRLIDVRIDWDYLRNSNGNVEGIISVISDITERVRARDELKVRNEQLLRITNNSPDMIYRMSLPDGLYEYVSPASAKITGYSPEEWYANPQLIVDIIHPDWHAYFRDQWSRLMKGEAPPTYEYQIIHKNGSTRWLNQRNFLVKDEKEKPVFIEGIVTDITDRKAVEEKILESEERYRLFHKAAGIGVGYYTAEGRVISFNEVALQHLGMKETDAVGKTLDELFSKQEADLYLERISRTIENDVPEDYTDMVPLPTGNKYFLSVYSCVKNLAGDNLGVQIMSVDITGQKMEEEHLHQTLLEKKELLKELQHRAKNSFAMINSMMSIASLRSVNQETKKYLKEMGVRIKSISQLYDILYTTDSVSEIRLDEYFSIIASTVPGIMGNVSIKTVLDKVVVPVKMASSLGLAVTELITNAVKHAFIPGIEGEISFSLKKTDRGCIVEVSDNGRGLPYEIDVKNSDSFGIELVHSLVKSIGGSFLITSSKGTSCIIEFPLPGEDK